MIPFRNILLSFLFGAVMVSCLETETGLQSGDYKIIDSLYTLQKDSITSILEAECLEFQDSILPLWIDSIKQKRELEIQQLINKPLNQ